MDVLNEIVKWATTELPEWQSDAVRRLLTQDSLSVTDEQELLLMLKAKHNLLTSVEMTPTPRPMDPADIAGTEAASELVTILAMKDLTNVNAIPPGSIPLTFGDKGVTIIYGDNASGKSGYARVLKKACRARHTETIYPDIHSQVPTSPPSASFVVGLIGNSQPQEFKWVDGTNAHEILGSICVFDSKCARIIIDEDNEVVYLPYGANVFNELTTLCQKFKGALEAERPQAIPITEPDIPFSTKAGKFIAALNASTTIEDLNTATKWSQVDEKKLQDLIIDISKATAEDPKQQAIRVRNIRQRIFDMKTGLESIATALSDESVVTMSNKISQVKTAERAFDIISQQSLHQEPLPGIEQNEWKELYKAAEEYSTKVAYTDKDFPFTGPDSVCVLCMQPLSQQAKERLQRFKYFMEQTTRKQLETAKINLLTTMKVLADIDLEILESYKDAFDEIATRNKHCADSLKAYVEKAMARKMSMESAGQTLSDFLVIELPTCPLSDIESILTSMEQGAAELERLAIPQQMSALNTKKMELAAGKKLAEIKPVIIKYLIDLKLAVLYNLCIKETDTTWITRRGHEIISSALTQQFKSLLDKELSGFGVPIQLSLDSRGAVGKTVHKIRLINCQL
ncbi:MAG: hypothetical protein A2173_07935, partial [Planctomycetes bacterium RBG_13_44_8b]